MLLQTEAVDREAEMTCGEVLEDNNNVNRVKRVIFAADACRGAGEFRT